MFNSKKEDKQYGLIKPKKHQLSVPKATNVFGDDVASDEDDGTDWVKKALKAENEKNKMKKQIKLSMQKALKEDSTIYQYDEVYDELEQTKAQTKVTKIQEKKPRYIQNLLKAAERRKKEQEHRIERMVQKEREAEGAMYADKESFVTSAYRAKLEEFKKMEEEEARMDRLETIGDVTKQKDMSGFYRHLYEQTVDNTEQTKSTVGVEADEKNVTGTEITDSSNNGKNPSNDVDSNEKIELNVLDDKKVSTVKAKRNRQYRQRVIETYETDSDSEVKNEENSKVKNVLNVKKDNIEIEEPSRKKQKCDTECLDNTVDAIINVPNDNNVKDVKAAVTENTDDKIIEKKENNIVNVVELSPKKERSSIWVKRTVGPVFEVALQRYYARKAIRLSAI